MEYFLLQSKTYAEVTLCGFRDAYAEVTPCGFQDTYAEVTLCGFQDAYSEVTLCSFQDTYAEVTLCCPGCSPPPCHAQFYSYRTEFCFAERLHSMRDIHYYYYYYSLVLSEAYAVYGTIQSRN